ncbi:twin-arginine translocase TatA/TatE family subunit [Halobacteriales archaeon SW_7_71_33]|nr:MAG: twin-arginine translocase TatA/TatE family subunit [Halobacteriales archaeon SW_7_71_33]
MLRLLQIGGIPGGPELLIVLLLAVLLFGASKIPKLARAGGEAIGEFQKGREEVESELEEMRDQPTSTSTSGSGSSETAQGENEEFVDTEPVTADGEE